MRDRLSPESLNAVQDGRTFFSLNCWEKLSMVKTASTMLPLGTLAPDFSLLNVDGRVVSLKDFPNAKGLLVAFICNHCPFVIHIRSEFAKFAREFQAKGLAIVAINSNDPT